MCKSEEITCPVCKGNLINIEIDDIEYKEYYLCNECDWQCEIDIK